MNRAYHQQKDRRMFDLIYRFDPAGRHGVEGPKTAEEAVQRLEEGNRIFYRMFDEARTAASQGTIQTRIIPVDADDLGVPPTDGTAPIQRPFAAVLGCSDARVPIEMVLNQTANRLFVVRVAGNVLGAECLGSLDYAITAMSESVKVILVLGHSGCGAVTAAADAFIEPSRYLGIGASFPLRAIIDRVIPAVRAAHWGLEQIHGQQVETLPGYRKALIEAAVVLNAALNAAALRKEFADRVGPERRVVYGVYNLISRQVKVDLETEENLSIDLAEPPVDAAGFERLAVLLGGSQTIRDCLGIGA